MGKQNFDIYFDVLSSSAAIHCQCRNPSFGLATKAKGLQGYGPRGAWE
jgi:hypothetical protein